MARRNLPKKVRKNDQQRTAYVRIPEYPYIYIFNIKSRGIRCINTCSFYFATGVSDVYDHDHPLIDKLLAQI
jgi:hypothetical protein